MKNYILPLLLTLLLPPFSFTQYSSLFMMELPPETIRESGVKTITATDENGKLLYKNYYDSAGKLVKAESPNRPVKYFVGNADEQPFAFEPAHPRGYILYLDADTLKEEQVYGSGGERKRLTRSICREGDILRKEIYPNGKELETYMIYEYDNSGRMTAEITYSREGQETSKRAFEYDSLGNSRTYFINESGRMLQEEKVTVKKPDGTRAERITAHQPNLGIKMTRTLEMNASGAVTGMSIDHNNGKPAVVSVMQTAPGDETRLEKTIHYEGESVISELRYSYLREAGRENLIDYIERITFEGGQAAETTRFQDFEYEFY
ncbi:MAG: hypothetical protein J5I98_22565 [Phaeodactylibacter sp.]|nr:hypothetical protein [Phaeodactylibacter sp.]